MDNKVGRLDTNLLWYGDNLGILREHIPDASVDLVYLDPPFSSNRNYNVIFKDESGNASDAQHVAFEDTWTWGPSAEAHYDFLTTTAVHQGRVGEPLGRLVAALRSVLGANQVMAYLVEMSIRLVELHRTLKPTGSLYLHCDPTASHYLKLVLDAIFQPRYFRNEIVWKRSDAHNDATQGAKRYGRIHDVLLFYTKSDDYTFNTEWIPLSKETADKWYRHLDEKTGRRFNMDNVTAAKPGGDTSYEFHGVKPPTGRFWAYSRANMERMWDEGRLVMTDSGKIYMKRYLEESKGTPAQDLWTDVDMLRGFSSSKERLGYPTQKPLALLERIIGVSSNPGDILLDPFCGCGTAVVAAQSLNRKWIGIDITFLAIAVMEARLRDAFHMGKLSVQGAPTEVEGARRLAQSVPNGRYQFQYWACTLIGAGPVGGIEKKGADRGIDGVMSVPASGSERHQILVSVKSGHVTSSMVRDLKGTVDREKAAMGLFVTLDEPTKEMRLEATTAGFYRSPQSERSYPRLQIVTIAELLKGVMPELPPLLPVYPKAARAKEVGGEALDLFKD